MKSKLNCQLCESLFNVTIRRSFNAKAPPVVYYLFKCCYFLLSAYQIRCGYPRRILGNCLTKGFSIFNLGKLFLLLSINRGETVRASELGFSENCWVQFVSVRMRIMSHRISVEGKAIYNFETIKLLNFFQALLKCTCWLHSCLNFVHSWIGYGLTQLCHCLSGSEWRIFSRIFMKSRYCDNFW